MKIGITLIAWFLWNWGELTIRKSELDDDNNPNTNFSFKEYMGIKWTYWVGSFAMIFILLWMGKIKIDLSQLDGIVGKLTWNDLYYLAPGAGFEALIFGIRWIRNYFKKRIA